MELDSFDSEVVVELPEAGAEAEASGSVSDGPESFDDMDVKGLDDSQVSQLEDDEGGAKDEPKEEDAKEEDKGKEDDAKEPEKDSKATDEEPKEEAKQLPRGKSLRVKDQNGDASDIDLDSTVKIKVNGKNEIVSLKDLRDNYSGKVSYDSKFESLQAEKTSLENDSVQFKAERDEMVDHIKNIASMLDDENKSPFDALNYLVDMSGRSTLDFNKKVMAHMADEVRNLDGMDEVERELYWNKKELDAVRSNQAAKDEKLTTSNAQREKTERITQLRESQGVTESQFVQSHKELKELGYEDNQVTAESIVNYAVMKPHYETAETVCQEYEDDLSDNENEKLISTVANTLKNYPKISEEKALETALNLLGWDYEKENDFKELNDKAPEQRQASKKKSGSYEYGKQSHEELDLFDDD